MGEREELEPPEKNLVQAQEAESEQAKYSVGSRNGQPLAGYD